jgi:hypothetical protein
MHGTITSKEVFLYWLTIIRLWGARCYLRCLRAALGRKPTTFLGVVTRCHEEADERSCDDASDPTPSPTPPPALPADSPGAG